MRKHPEHFRPIEYIIFSLATLAVMCLCVCVGSVSIPLPETVRAIWGALSGHAQTSGLTNSIILSVRLPAWRFPGARSLWRARRCRDF